MIEEIKMHESYAAFDYFKDILSYIVIIGVYYSRLASV